MKSHTSSQQQGNAASRRSSGGQRMSMGGSVGGGSSIPRVQSRIALARASTTQPSYDFLTGADRPPSRERGFRTSLRGPPTNNAKSEAPYESEQDHEQRRRLIDELKAEIKTLQYTIDNHKQEEELAKLRHESELRDTRRKGEEDFRKMQAADSEKSKVLRQCEALLQELGEVKNGSSNKQTALERQVREAEESKRILEDEAEEMKSEKEEIIRILNRKIAELETRNDTLQQSVEELQQDSDKRELLLQETQQQLVTKDTSIGKLEGEVLRLAAQVVDVDSAQTVKREMNEQLSHVRKLEATNRSQEAELRHLKQIHKAAEVVEEEKRSLQRKLDAKEGLEHELGEAIIQRQRLEDERLGWTAYLQSQGGPDGQLEFDSPESLARAFITERIQTATLTERIGALEAEISEKDSIIQGLGSEMDTLKQQVEKAKASAVAGAKEKSLQRLERQKALANKEVQYLRDQLKVYDSEDATFQPDQVDEAKQKRIQELEEIVDQYRLETQTLTTELQTREQPQGIKRSFEPSTTTEDSERLGQLSRKNRKLQDEFSSLASSHRMLEKELQVAKDRLAAASKERETRVLSLRSNPTSDFEAIKQATLNALRKENEDLLAQLKTQFQQKSTHPAHAQIPLSTLESQILKTTSLADQLASQQKRNDRLLKTWGTKTSEFRQSIVDLLGWDVQFLKDGKMKVTSRYYPANDEEENSILFDGVRGSMKVSGGPESKFAGKIGDSIKYWVRGKSCVPGLLAALTLEFFEEANRDGTVLVDV